MTLEKEILKIKGILEEYDKRISALEKKIKGATQKTVTKKKVPKSISDHLEFIKSKGFFDKPRTTSEIVERLGQEGYHYPPQSLTWSLQKTVQNKMLGRIKKDRKWAYCKR